jgi:hypothetical protein
MESGEPLEDQLDNLNLGGDDQYVKSITQNSHSLGLKRISRGWKG